MVKGLADVTTDAQREMVEGIITKAREMLEADGILIPVGFVVKGRAVHIVFMQNFVGEAAKDSAAAYLSKMSADLGADMVVFVGEAWSVTRPNVAEASKVVDVASEPDREEVVAFEVETWRGRVSGLAKQTRVSKHSATFGEVSWEETLSGRFVGILAADAERN